MNLACNTATAFSVLLGILVLAAGIYVYDEWWTSSVPGVTAVGGSLLIYGGLGLAALTLWLRIKVVDPSEVRVEAHRAIGRKTPRLESAKPVPGWQQLLTLFALILLVLSFVGAVAGITSWWYLLIAFGVANILAAPLSFTIFMALFGNAPKDGENDSKDGE